MKIELNPSAARLGSGRAGMRERGFTLIELIMVMVMLGVLAVFAAPRIFNSDDFYARGFHDETLGLLRYAQKTAVAQRRTVCVSFPTTGSATLSIAANAPTPTTPTPTCSPALPLIGPRGESPATIPATDHGASYNGLPGNFNFNGLGQPMSTAGVLLGTQTVIQINNASNVFVEAVTGYVHD